MKPFSQSSNHFLIKDDGEIKIFYDSVSHAYKELHEYEWLDGIRTYFCCKNICKKYVPWCLYLWFQIKHLCQFVRTIIYKSEMGLVVILSQNMILIISRVLISYKESQVEYSLFLEKYFFCNFILLFISCITCFKEHHG